MVSEASVSWLFTEATLCVFMVSLFQIQTVIHHDSEAICSPLAGRHSTPSSPNEPKNKSLCTQAKKGGASEPHHFLGSEEGIKAACMLNVYSVESCIQDLVDTCLRRSRNTLGSCSASFNGRVQQGRWWSDHRSLVLGVFYLPTTVPASSRFLDVQPAKRH